jgi:hypothetical protein
MSGLVTEEDEQEMNDEENPNEEGEDKDCSQAFFLVCYQLMEYHRWLSFHPKEAALFWRFEVSYFACLV